MSGKLEGRVAIVTGAAGGIGAETVLRLAAEGADVVAADLDLPGAERAAAAALSAGGKATARHLDLAEEDSIRALVEATVRDQGPIRILHNNANDSSRATLDNDGAIATLDADVWDRTFRINARGTMLMTKHSLKSMVGAGGGSIIITSTGAAVMSDIARPSYGASKSALLAFTRSVATQYGKFGVRCNAICPGLILTESVRATLAPEVFDMVIRHTLTPRLGEPRDIAAMVAFLASEDAGFITGQVMNVDGGNTMHYAHVAHIYDDFMAATGNAGIGGGA